MFSIFFVLTDWLLSLLQVDNFSTILFKKNVLRVIYMIILVIKTQACILFNFTLPNKTIALISTNNFHIIIAQITLFS